MCEAAKLQNTIVVLPTGKHHPDDVIIPDMELADTYDRFGKDHDSHGVGLVEQEREGEENSFLCAYSDAGGSTSECGDCECSGAASRSVSWRVVLAYFWCEEEKGEVGRGGRVSRERERQEEEKT